MKNNEASYVNRTSAFTRRVMEKPEDDDYRINECPRVINP
jgi:hypothetical protein